MRYHRRRRSQKRPLIVVVLILLGMSIASFFFLDARIRPVVRGIAQTQAENLSSKLINQSVIDVLNEEGITYDDLVTLEKDEKDQIKAVQANVIKSNSLKAKISDQVSKKLSGIKREEIEIPLGTLIGSDFFIGRGPKIRLYMSLTGYINTDLVSKFESAGINQTLHSIMLNMDTNIYIIVPGYNTSTNVKTNMCIAQTVIVGLTPDSYSNIVTDMNSYSKSQIN